MRITMRFWPCTALPLPCHAIQQRGAAPSPKGAPRGMQEVNSAVPGSPLMVTQALGWLSC